MHILDSAGTNLYRVVVHTNTPVGNNSAGVAWTAALAASGLNVSQLTVGNGAGQITQNEMNQITNGTVFETTFVWGDDPSWTNQQRLDDLNVRAGQAVAEAAAVMQARLKFYGHTVA
jgi:hypothetical protein